MLAVPWAVIDTAVPFSVPEASPEMLTPPPHVALNVPEIDVEVCVVIWYWKLPQLVGLGSAGSALVDAHVPTSDGVACVLPEPGGLVPLVGVTGLVLSTDVGTSTLDWWSYAHAENMAATASGARSERGLCI
jgi:hypothetical protein